MPQGQTSGAATHGAPAAVALRQVIRSWRGRAWLGLAVVVGLWALRFRLFDVLGFELAAAAAIPASLIALDVGVVVARRTAAARAAAGVPSGLAAGATVTRDVLGALGAAIAIAVVVTAVPAVLAAFNGLRRPTCDWGFGLRAYASLPTASAVVFAGAGVAIGLAAGRRGWLAAVGAVALVLGLAIAGLARFYGEPPVFVYNPLVGYFPGNLYDENIRIGLPLYAARAEQLLVVIAALAALRPLLAAPTLQPRRRERRPRGWRWPWHAGAAVAAAGALLLRAHAGDLGYAIDAEDIQRALGGRIETPHFVIHYADRPDVAADAALLAQEHEFRLDQVVHTLGLDQAGLDAFTGAGRIHSYYFASRDQKAALMGARDVEMAKPWRREIYLTASAFPHRSLRHEIAHVVAGLFGDPWFHTSAEDVAGMPLAFRPGLIEGLAVAVDWPGNYDQALTPHQAVRALQQMGVQPDVGDLLSLSFFTSSSVRSYTTAGSFVRFLLDAHGPERLRRLYRSGGDFQAAYGEPLAALVEQWRQLIAATPLADAEVEVVRERFRRGSVFQRPCPHAIAARRMEAAEALARGDRPAAVRLLRVVCGDEPGEPRYRLDLAGALAGGSDAERAEAVAIYQAIAGDAEHMTSSLRAEAVSAMATLAVRRGDRAGAEALVAEGAAMPLADDQGRQLDAELLALRHAGPAGGALRAYFFGTRLDDGGDDAATAAAADDDDDDAATGAASSFDAPMAWTDLAIALEPELGLGYYLRGLQRGLRGDHAGAADDLATALGRGLPSARFARNAARKLAVSAWRAGDLARVEQAAARLAADDMTEMDHLLAADWRARLAFAPPRVTSR
ncbi:MAG: hypothetical protein H6708_28795 [Kofleriaceae bacterium]|nr:hypothetical protein [Kofleriaceae bacterium]